MHIEYKNYIGIPCPSFFNKFKCKQQGIFIILWGQIQFNIIKRISVFNINYLYIYIMTSIPKIITT